MIALYILLAIIALIVLAFSFRLTVQLDYRDVVELEIRYLFLKFKLLPWEQKEKKPKEAPAPAPEEPQKESPKKKKGSAKQNPLKTFWDNEGIDGVIALLKKTASILSGMFRGVFRHIVLDKFFLQMYIGSGDAAQTATDYGQTCAEVFPALGTICSVMKVRKYDVDISPDFLANQNETELHAVLTLRPIFVTNAAVVMVIRLLFQVVFKLLFSKPDKSNENRIEIKQQGGASL